MNKYLNKIYWIVVLGIICPVQLWAGPETKVELLQQIQLKVTGLKCESCIPDVRKSLKKVPGVRDARVTHFDKTGSSTVVETVPGKVESQQLVRALKSDGFRAEVLFVGEPRQVILETDSGFSFFGLFNQD